MMATEPSTNNPADVSASPEPQLVTDAQHGDLEPPTLNRGSTPQEDIANKRITSVEDQINSADVSVSGGSDTEASRAKDGDKGHGRTGSSIKKPATFKAVSVNKTFLASKANPAGASSRSSDKPSTGSSTPPTGSATLSASRPRLVAKTASGARDSLPRFSSVVNGGKPAAAPDPSAVWNKNRPTPAPEPKRFTDEELKKYGIHMASRLNEDDAQGQNKWADIDDDDDDWAPETITWGDGTKTTLPHPDEPPAPSSDNGSVGPKGVTQEKPASPAPSGLPSTPVPKYGGLPSGKGLVLKTATQDKPALVAKPPAPPAPVKPAWAPLPPVKASPVAVEPTYPSRGSLKEPSSLKTSAPQPSKEIAGDDFSRTAWRDRTPYANNHLYNSRSGRYEPVTDRRGSTRSDSQTRYPALLQRTPQSDQPAEPSPAFQKNRTAQDGPLGRRRGSSNVSGGSGSYLQRIGKGNDGAMPPPELLSARKASLAGSVESQVSPVVLPLSGQGQSRHQPPSDWAPRPSPRANFAVPHYGSANAELQPGPAPQRLEDDIEYQKRLMREGVELARKRRQEEEAREEAARRERIQKKLEALGPPPERKSDMKDNVLKDDVAKPVQSQQHAPGEQTGSSSTEAPSHAGSDRVEADATNHRERSGPSAKEVSSANLLPPGSVSRRLSHGQDAKPSNVWGGSGSRSDRFSSWVAGARSNVWSSPDSDRGLGNGTFNPDLGRISGASAPPPQNNNAPPPIGPPTTSQPSSQGRPQVPAPIGSRAAQYAAPGAELASKWVTAVADNDKKLSAERLAERVGRDRQLAERGMTIDDVQPTIKDTWRQVHVPGDGNRHTMGSVEVQSHPPGPWKASRQDFSKGAPPADDGVSGGPPGVIGPGGNSVLPLPLPQQGPTAPPQSRPSRFFPTKDTRADGGSIVEPPRPTSPSPPPPTMEGHPAYEGDVTHPHVSLPKPHPVVKLPPSMVALQSSQSKLNNVWTSKAPHKDSSRAPVQRGQSSRQATEPSPKNWQDKINSLLNGGRTSFPKHMGVDPASRSALDHATNQDSTTVSLPSSKSQYSFEDPNSPTSKPMAEECFEEQEMGSLPQIRLPHKAPEAAWQPATVHTKPLPRRLHVQASVMEPGYFAAEDDGGGTAIRVDLPGMTEPKLIVIESKITTTTTVPTSTTRGRGGHSRPPSRHRGSGHGPRGGKREFSNAYGDSTSSSSTGRGARGGYRSRGSETWRRVSQSQQQASLSA